MITVDVTFLYIIVVFLLTSWVLKRFLFAPLSGILEGRESRAKTARQAYAESLSALQRAVAEAEEKLSLARREALKARESLRAEGSAVLDRRLSESRAAAESAVNDAARQIAAQAAATAKELPGEARGLARALAEKVLGRKLAA